MQADVSSAGNETMQQQLSEANRLVASLKAQVEKDEIRIEKLLKDRTDIQAEFDELEQNYYNLIQVCAVAESSVHVRQALHITCVVQKQYGTAQFRYIL
jgi:chromosome segregation ATPase